jgi:type IV pilus assembly protein PilP
MHLQLYIKKILPALLGVAIIFSGFACENKTEQPPKPKVVAQKIQMDSTDTAKPMAPENDVSSESIPDQETDQEEMITREDTGAFPDENDLALKADMAAVPAFYNPENKIDPFMPLFKEGPKEDIEISQKVEREKRLPRTPLERIDLSQLKLVGIIQSPSGNKGLVEEATGKGYIISMGTYMGTNGGRVVEISKDRVIIEEEVDDVLGKLTLQRRELKLQKPFGEN